MINAKYDGWHILKTGIIKEREDINLECPTCGFKETEEEKFRDGTTYCDVCGEHSAIFCPQCDDWWDHVDEDRVCGVCGLILGAVIIGKDSDCHRHPGGGVVSWKWYLGRGK